jgi:methylenetetrahydrofolate dehydrogenase (NADP+)/methenyltetrahydrofolate cyclohydrolase
MAELLNGAPVVEALNRSIALKAVELAGRGIIPTLAIVRIGERQDDIAYERGAVKRCEKTSVQVRQVLLPADVTQERLIDELQKLNADTMVHGILLFRPLPKGIDDNAVRNMVAPSKDIDGITDLSLAGVFTGSAIGYPPCTAQACMEILNHYGIDPAVRRTVVIGRSLVVGKPLTMMLIARNATVTVCHTRTMDMPELCRKAEILIASAGRAKVVGKSCLSPNQIVIDVGINVDENGNMCGDVHFQEAEQIVKAITPVPGGVGTVTTSVLVKHVVEAAAKSAETG